MVEVVSGSVNVTRVDGAMSEIVVLIAVELLSVADLDVLLCTVEKVVGALV